MRSLYFFLLFLFTAYAHAADGYGYFSGDLRFRTADEACIYARDNIFRTSYKQHRLGPPNEYGTMVCWIAGDASFSDKYVMQIEIFERDIDDPLPSNKPQDSPSCTFGAYGTATLFAGIIDKDGAQVGEYQLPSTYGGCVIQLTDVQNCWSYKTQQEADLDRPSFCDFTFTYTGEVAPEGSPDDIEGESPAFGNQGCPSGYSNTATDRSDALCVANNPDNPLQITTSQKKVTREDGSIETTTTERSVFTNPDGSKTVTTSVTTSIQHPDGSIANGPTEVTVEDIGTIPKGENTGQGNNSNGGNSSGGNSDNTDPTNFCKSNPTLTVCKESSIDANCTSFTCEGDAIQCAIVRLHYENSCRIQSDRTLLEDASYSSLGRQLLGGTDPFQEMLPTPQNAVTISISELNSAGFLGDAQCLQDKNIELYGRTVVVPLSSSCQYFFILRLVIMATASLVALRIISSAVKG